MPEPPPPHRFSLHDVCMCYHQPSDRAYEAKIIGIEEFSEDEGSYTVHYTGWAKRYDEKITFEEAAIRMYNMTKAQYTEKYGSQEPVKTPKSAAKKRASSSAFPLPTAGDQPTTSGTPTASRPPTAEDPSTDKKSRLAFPKVSTEVFLTPSLVSILLDDYDVIHKGFIPKLPAKITVDQIMMDYKKTIPVRDNDYRNIDDVIIEYDESEVRTTNIALICTANGVLDYCNYVAGSRYQLLYEQERLQHEQLIRVKAVEMGLAANTPINTVVAKGFRHTSQYGIVQLVRLLSRLPKLLPLTEWEPRHLHRIMIGIHDLLVFLNKNWRRYHHGMDMYMRSEELVVEEENEPIIPQKNEKKTPKKSEKKVEKKMAEREIRENSEEF